MNFEPRQTSRNLLVMEWPLLVYGLLMSFWSSPGQTFFISLFGGQIRSELSLSHGEFGAIYSIATLSSAALMIWTGPLVDRIDLKKISAVVIAGLAVGCGLLSLSNSLILLVISVFLLRHTGQGLMLLCGSTAMVRYLEPVKGKASSIASMGYPLGEAVLPSIVVAMLGMLSWRTSWQILVVVLFGLVLPVVLICLRGHRQRHERYLATFKSSGPNTAHVDARRHWTRAEVLKDLKFYLILPGLLSQPLMFTGFIFHQVHLVETKGWALSMWGALFVVYALISVGFNLICGLLVDRYGASRILPFFPIPLAIGLLVLTMSSAPLAALIFLVLTGVTVGMSTPLSAPFFTDLYGSRHIGSIKSMTTAAMVLFSALSPVVLGWLFDIGIRLETLTFFGAVYIFATSALAYWTCHRYIYSTRV
ncbi:MAG: MFS transporter [Pseudomonadota bacterium]